MLKHQTASVSSTRRDSRERLHVERQPFCRVAAPPHTIVDTGPDAPAPSARPLGQEASTRPASTARRRRAAAMALAVKDHGADHRREDGPDDNADLGRVEERGSLEGQRGDEQGHGEPHAAEPRAAVQRPPVRRCPAARRHRAATAARAAPKIPSGFPAVSPSTIPTTTRQSSADVPIVMPALANANSGMMTNAESVCSGCSRRSSGAITPLLASPRENSASCCPLLVSVSRSPVSVRSNSSSSLRASAENSAALMRVRVGMVSASATPAMVE